MGKMDESLIPTIAPQQLLTPRWTPLRKHETQDAYWTSPHRFNVVPAGRRSGKTELAKRKLVKRAMNARTSWNPSFFAGAPIRDQAKRIFWDDLKALVPDWALAGKPSESDLMIPLINGSEIWVVGLDKPERIEGKPWDGGILDEFANMKGQAWGANVRPSLSDRLGWCDLIGVPEGRNHYFELYQKARAERVKHGMQSEWGTFTWKSADILPYSEIEAARRDLDPLTFQQEYEASFVHFEGAAYYRFNTEVHANHHLLHFYNPRAPLIFCFDFNVEPGVAVVLQEAELPGIGNGRVIGTLIIGEVWIPNNSNTPAVCRKLIEQWGPTGPHRHRGEVRCYGDATGGARGSAQTEGSDWDLIEATLRPVFKERLSFHVDSSNPTERARINAVNSRLLSAGGDIRLMVDPTAAAHVVTDLEGVPLLKGGSGEIDKKAAPKLSHLSDALGYYINKEFPIIEAIMQRVALGGV